MAEIDMAILIDERGMSTLQWRAIGLCAVAAMLGGYDTQSIAFAAPAIASAASVASRSRAPPGEPARRAPG